MIIASIACYKDFRGCCTGEAVFVKKEEKGGSESPGAPGAQKCTKLPGEGRMLPDL